MEAGDAEPGGPGAEQAPVRGGPWSRRPAHTLQLLHGREEPLKRVKDLVRGQMAETFRRGLRPRLEVISQGRRKMVASALGWDCGMASAAHTSG